jgi:uncharacterized membrane protein YqaE (UPF0057 family)
MASPTIAASVDARKRARFLDRPQLLVIATVGKAMSPAAATATARRARGSCCPRRWEPAIAPARFIRAGRGWELGSDPHGDPPPSTRIWRMDLLRILLAILLPPLGVFLQVGLGLHFWLNILLTLLGYIPGIVHAVWIIARR